MKRVMITGAASGIGLACVKKFLGEGNKVKVSIRMRGRQMAHSNLSIDVMNRFFEMMEGCAVMEKKPLTEGRNVWMMLAQAPQK
jgi:translation initiation factor IF-3